MHSALKSELLSPVLSVLSAPRRASFPTKGFQVVWIVYCSIQYSFSTQQFTPSPVQWSGTMRKYLSMASQKRVRYSSGETTVGILPAEQQEQTIRHVKQTCSNNQYIEEGYMIMNMSCSSASETSNTCMYGLIK